MNQPDKILPWCQETTVTLQKTTFFFCVFVKPDSQLTLCTESFMDHETSGTVLLSGPGPKQVTADIIGLFSLFNVNQKKKKKMLTSLI